MTLYVPELTLEDYRDTAGSGGIGYYFQHIEPIPPLTGDVDGDGNISVADITNLIDLMLKGGVSPTDYPDADVDGDGNVTIADVTKIIDMLLHK